MSNTPSSLIIHEEESPGQARVTPRAGNPPTPRDPPNLGGDYFTPTGSTLPFPSLSDIRLPSGSPSPDRGRSRDLRYHQESAISSDHRSRSPHHSTPNTSARSRSRCHDDTSDRRSILGLSPLEVHTIQDTGTLVSPRKSVSRDKEAPKAPNPVGCGQEFASSETLTMGIAPEERAKMRLEYAAHMDILRPPTLDLGVPAKLFIEAWPQSKPTNSKYGPFLREKELVNKQLELAEWARPSIQQMEIAQLSRLPLADKKASIRCNVDTLQYIGEKHYGYTRERRLNIFMASPIAKYHAHLLDEKERFGAWPETREHLFGPTFMANITNELKETAETRKAFNLNRSVPNFNDKCPILINLLNSLNLPFSKLPITFNVIPPVNFIGGRIHLFIKNWYLLTSLPDIINVIRGHNINFIPDPPPFKDLSRPGRASTSEGKVIQSLLHSKVIEITNSEGFVSPIFLKRKPSGLHRLILDLSALNLEVEYNHFKMQSLSDALLLVKQNDWLTKIDLTSAYDCCPIAPASRKYLQFKSDNILYQYRGFPNGLAEAPRLFTLITRPVRELLNHLGIRHVLYLDDLLIMAESIQLSKNYTSTAIQIFHNLGFVINCEKSVVDPSTCLEFLGFKINTKTLFISLTDKKVEKVKESCKLLQSFKLPSKRQIACTVGLLVSVTPAVLLGPLHYRGLQRLQNSVMTNWESKTSMTEDAMRDLSWWIHNIHLQNGTSFKQIPINLTLMTDASATGWGAVLGNQTAQDFWSEEEKLLHINILELAAIHRGMLSLLWNYQHICLLIKSDSMVALANIRKKGNTKCTALTNLATLIWEFAKERSITLITQHIPGKINNHADYLSRLPRDQSDWLLNRDVWREINLSRGPLWLDLFSREWNKQTEKFVSWRSQPAAWEVNALSIPWPKQGAYAFPPFGLISESLQKVRTEQCTVVLIAPVWKTQPWYSNLLQMSCKSPLLLPNSQNLLTDYLKNSHPLLKTNKLTLAAWTVSGDCSKVRGFQQELLKSSFNNKEPQLNALMTVHGGNGLSGIVKGIPIHFHRLSHKY